MQTRKVNQDIGMTEKEEAVLARIVDNPGITTLNLAESSKIPFLELISILKALMYSNLVRQTPKTEWFSNVEEA